MSWPPVATGPADPETGLVFRSAVAGPSTHVLILGIGSYPWSSLAELTSPGISARAVADWFLGDGPGGFHHRSRPLGSLAILLSEPVPGRDKADAKASRPRAVYRDVAVPRPDRAAAQAAAKAWRTRLAADPGNMAVIYCCGHGLSDQGRNALILEDYGIDPDEPYRALIDVDDFIRAAGTLPVPAQVLLFDCCRDDARIGLDRDGQIGDRLIPHAGSRRPDVEQVTMFATMPSREAAGRTGATSLFASSLLTALDVGSTRRNGTWVIKPGSLFDALAECLRLHGRSPEDVQKPDGALRASTFDIHFPRYAGEIRTFVSLADMTLWEDASITLLQAGAPYRVVAGRDTPEPFCETFLPAGSTFGFSARVGDHTYLADGCEVGPPWVFMRLGPADLVPASTVEGDVGRNWNRIAADEAEESDAAPADSWDGGPSRWIAGAPAGDANTSSGWVRPSRSPGSYDYAPAPRPAPRRSTVLEVAVDAPQLHRSDAVEGVVVSVEPLEGGADTEPPDQVASIFGEISVTGLAAGRHRVSIALPDGRRMTRTVSLTGGERTRVTFTIGDSPRESLAAAFLMGAVGARGLDIAGAGPRAAEGAIRIVPTRPPRFGADPSPVRVEDPGAVRFKVDEDAHAPFRYAAVTVADLSPLRFQPDHDAALLGAAPSPDGGRGPLWAEVTIGALREICAVPALGRGAEASWDVGMVVDRRSPHGRSHATAFVDSSLMGGLLGHLAQRDFERCTLVLDAVEASDRKAFKSPYNPLAGFAAALIRTATASVDRQGFDDALLRLAQRYPGIPDGAVVLARRRWSLARSDEDLAAVRDLFLEGFRRGVPTFSLAVDWLAQGLAALAGRTAEAEAAAAFARRVDSGRTWTTLRWG